jgi:hypothetical protein
MKKIVLAALSVVGFAFYRRSQGSAGVARS